MLLSFLQWAIFILASFQLTKWKEKQPGKVSTKWKLGESSLFKLLKEGKISFKQSLVSTIRLLIDKLWPCDEAYPSWNDVHLRENWSYVISVKTLLGNDVNQWFYR